MSTQMENCKQKFVFLKKCNYLLTNELNPKKKELKNTKKLECPFSHVFKIILMNNYIVSMYK